MTLKLQIIIACIVLLALFYIINMVKKKKLQLKNSLSWIVLCIAVLILDIFPQIMQFLTDLSGIEVASNMLFFIGFLVVLAMLYSAGVAISTLQIKVQRLTQEVALLKKELEEKSKDIKTL